MSAKVRPERPRNPYFPKPITPENYPGRLNLARNQHSFRWDNMHAYSLAVSAGYGVSDFKNGHGLDHRGPSFGIAAGLRVPWGAWRDHILLPRLYYEFQGNSVPLGKDLALSRSRTQRFGLELNYLYEAVPAWLQVGASFEFGLAAYRSAKGELPGVWVNGAGRLRPLRSVGTHLEAGALVCTFDAAVCLNAGYGGDFGLKIEREGFNARGVTAGVDLDVLRFFRTPTPKAVRRQLNRGRSSKA